MPKTKARVDENWKKLLLKHPELKKKKEKATKSQLEVVEEVIRKKAKGKPKTWFDDVDNIYLENDIEPTKDEAEEQMKDEDETQKTVNLNDYNPLVKDKSFQGLTKVVAIDCEMVGVGDDGKDSILARISLVNHFGQCIYDKFVKPTESVTDYRTVVSGIRPSDMEKGEDFKVIQKEVYDIIRNRVLVGHALQNDLKVLYLDHPRKMIRDTSRYKPFKKLFNGNTPSLKRLTERLLGVGIQSGEHSSIQDAQAAMRLYTMHRQEWEHKKPKWNLSKKMKAKNGNINGKDQQTNEKKKKTSKTLSEKRKQQQ